MLKKFLKFLLYSLIVFLISALVIVGFILMKWPIDQAFVVLGFLFGGFFTILILRKLYIRYRAKQQVKRVISEGEVDESVDLGMSPAELIAMPKAWPLRPVSCTRVGIPAESNFTIRLGPVTSA